MSISAAAQILIAAVTVALLLRIAWVDFTTQRIANRDALAIGALGAGGLAVTALQTTDWWSLALAAIVSATFFLVLFLFWLAKKVGAGDVKLMAAAPLVAGPEGLMAFSILLLIFAAITAFLVKNPLLLPAPTFRHYLDKLDRKGVVPFGVPIAASLIGVVFLRFWV
ncbi:peptidase [Mesorhizobium sp. L-8-10]|uniref:prepilin peptidase n=1 Tax=Mesorhizobium sp. L-8-10 TaxID=2744523 RepID=UPI00192844C3|nr:prepilin peptidase [Mesorhizobium sp. L-8-10]BCH33023.1 peptidase [Mesorhizobium sp. L-8-10]